MQRSRKGITPVIAIVLLLIIAVAVVGLAYGFIIGFFNVLTSKAAIVQGVSQCDTSGFVTVTIANVGTGDINREDVTIRRTRCQPATCPTLPTNFSAISNGQIPPGGSGTLTEFILTSSEASECKIGNTCLYNVQVGGVAFPTRADC